VASLIRDCYTPNRSAAVDRSDCADRFRLPAAAGDGRRDLPIPRQIQALIRRMANENPAWGEQRIANEFLLKLGIRLSPRTVSKYLSRRPPGRPRGDLRWSTFLRLHAQGIIACDFLVTVTATFRLLYVLSRPL